MGQLAEELERWIARNCRAMFLRDPDEMSGDIEWSHVDAIVIRSPFCLSHSAIARCPRLQMVIRAGTGADNIDLDLLAARGITFHTCAGAANSVAELAIGGVLALFRDFAKHKTELAKGTWRKYQSCGRELAGARLGIVGFGRIGCRIAQLAGAFGASCVAIEHDHELEHKRARAARLDVQLTTDFLGSLPQVDVLVLACPLTEKTRGLIDRAALAQLRAESVLVNIGRGALWNQEAVFEALLEERIYGLVCDVYEQEPPPANSIFEHPRVVSTPHIGAQTVETHERIAEQVEALLHPFLQQASP